MLHIKFKNLERSDIAFDAVQYRINALADKFPDLKQSRISVTLEMENSPLKAGPDLFKVKIFISKGKYDGIAISKEDSNLYVALADLSDHMLEKLNRHGDRQRVKRIAKERQFIRQKVV